MSLFFLAGAPGLVRGAQLSSLAGTNRRGITTKPFVYLSCTSGFITHLTLKLGRELETKHPLSFVCFSRVGVSRSARSSDSSQALLSLMVGLLLTLYPGTVGSPHLTTPGYNTRLLQYHLLSWFSCLEGAVLGQEWGERCQHLAKVLSIAVQSGFPVYFTQLEQV